MPMPFSPRRLRHALASVSPAAMLAATLAFPAAVHAETASLDESSFSAESTEDDPRITVIGDRTEALTSDTPEDARAKANRLAGGASVLDLADTEGRRNATLADVLRLVPGVFAAPRFGQEDLRLAVRGSGISRTGHGKGVLLIRDGVPINAADGQFDPFSLDLAAASHLSVLRGFTALGVGATTMGGAIVLESRTGRNNPGIRLEADGGSFNTWRLAGSAGVAGERLDGFIAASKSASNGFREHSETDALRLSGNVGWRITPDIETRLFAGHTVVNNQWPFPLNPAQFAENPRQAPLVSIRRQTATDLEQSFVSSRTTFASGLDRVTLALGYDDRFKDHPTPEFILLQNNKSVTGSLIWERQSATNPQVTPITLGVRAMHTDEDAQVFAYAGLVNSTQSAEPGRLNEDRVREARNLEIFGRGELPLGRDLVASASLAAVWTNRSVSDVPGPDNPMGMTAQYSQTFSDILPAVGLIWTPQPAVTVFGGYSRTFEAPSFFDLGGNAPLQPDRVPRLDAQTTDSIEVGARGQAGAWQWDVTLYHSRINGELLRSGPAFALNPPIVNARRTLRTGLETYAAFDLAGLLGGAPGANMIAVKYDWISARFDNDPVFSNNIIAGIPEHNAFIELQVQPVAGLVVRPNLTLRSRTTTDFVNTRALAAPGFALLGLSVRYETGRVAIWVDARNLTDKAFVSATNVFNTSNPNAGLFFPGDGRSVFAGVTLGL